MYTIRSLYYLAVLVQNVYVHLQEGKELLGDEALEKTRAQTEALKEATTEESSPQKPSVPRDNTMVVTAQVNEQILYSYSSLPLSTLLSLSLLLFSSLLFSSLLFSSLSLCLCLCL